MSYNPSLQYYKHYYDGFDFNLLLEEKKNELKRNEEAWKKEPKTSPFYKPNKCLFDFQVIENQYRYSASASLLGFSLTSTYPGLLIGTGYTHGSGILGEFKIGFFFDYTTGLPLIPGSSIKGLLRSAFPCQYEEKAKALEEKGKNADAAKWKLLAKGRLKFIQAILAKLDYSLPEGKMVQDLEKEIFEGLIGTDRNKGEHHFSMSDRDIFHDAIISGSSHGKIFADDYITPHKNQKGDGVPDAMKNPVPIQLLKVLPDVDFQFQFDLKEEYSTWKTMEDEEIIEKTERLLNPDQRIELFRQILLFLGAGAKTNVGYGKWKPKNGDAPRIALTSTRKASQVSQTIPESNKSTQVAPVMVEEKQEVIYKPLRKGEKVQAIVVEDAKTPPMHIALKLMVIAPGQEQIAFYRFPAGRDIGTKAVVEIQEIKPVLRITNLKWI